ncbi:hypothetical protein BJX70DRAFT_378583, partial [Aspergillus crustosus]
MSLFADTLQSPIIVPHRTALPLSGRTTEVAFSLLTLTLVVRAMTPAVVPDAPSIVETWAMAMAMAIQAACQPTPRQQMAIPVPAQQYLLPEATWALSVSSIALLIIPLRLLQLQLAPSKPLSIFLVAPCLISRISMPLPLPLSHSMSLWLHTTSPGKAPEAETGPRPTFASPTSRPRAPVLMLPPEPNPTPPFVKVKSRASTEIGSEVVLDANRARAACFPRSTSFPRRIERALCF